MLTIIILLSVSAVSAADNADSSDNLAAADNQNVIKAAGDGDFNDLKTDISGDNVNLQKNYTYNSLVQTDPDFNPKTGVKIDHSCTIDGHGKYIDGRDVNTGDSSRIFTVNADNVVLKNIIFLNANHTAVMVTGANCVIDNCTFHDNIIDTDDSPGAAVYWTGNQGTITNSYFYNNIIATDDDDEDDRGAAIFWKGDDGTVKYCNFTNNSARVGTAISWGYFYYNETTQTDIAISPKRGLVDHCNFDNNTAYYHGAAITTNGEDFTIKYSNFTNNTGVFSAVIIQKHAKNANVSQCIFLNNTAICHDFFKEGNYVGSAALEILGEYATVEYCDFINNTAYDGDYWFEPQFDLGDFVINGADIINYTENGISYSLDLRGKSDEEKGQAVDGVLGDYSTWENLHLITLYQNIKIISVKKHMTSYAGAAKVGGSGFKAVFDNCNFINNSANWYGGLEFDGKNGTVMHSNFTNNTANNGDAGAIQWGGDAIYGVVLDCNFTNNSATGWGGAVYWDAYYGNVSYSNFTNNSANVGGAVVWNGESGNVSYSNFTINSADNGGAIYWGDYAFNGNVLSCNFTNNSATGWGGAVYWNSENGDVSYSNFTDNSADNGGAIYWSGYDGEVSYSIFTNNSADEGGAIKWEGNSGTVNNDSYFINNNATHGGAIKWNAENGIILNSSFIDNLADEKGGAIFWDENGLNGEIINSTFSHNSAYEGGALFWHEYGENGKIINSTFKYNSADENGGAIKWQGENGNVTNGCYFINNSAIDGGAIVVDWTDYFYLSDNCYFINNTATKSGGAIKVDGEFANITNNCHFINNTAKGEFGGAIFWYNDNGYLSNNCSFINNTAPNGGAIAIDSWDFILTDKCSFINNSASNWGGAIYWTGENGLMDDYCYLYNNTADLGGAIYWSGDNGNIDYSFFTGNNATNGSAIYKTDGCTLTIKNSEFDKNRANSTHVDIRVDKNETYALAEVTVDIYLWSNDNIANAIWNDGDVTTIFLENINCTFSENGLGRSKHTFNDGTLKNPHDGYVNSNELWQSYYENAQLLEINITDVNGVVLYRISGGQETERKNNYLRSIRFDDENFNVTDTDGKISVPLKNLKAGTYYVEAEHLWDKYYTNVRNTNSFVVYDVNLTITKTANVTKVANTNLVNYTITVKNVGSGNASNVIINETLPDNLTYNDWGIVERNDANIGRSNIVVDNGVSLTVSNITSGKYVSVWITATVKTDKLGNITNVVKTNCDENKTVVSNSTNVTVVPVVLNINKTANVTKVADTNLVNYTITVKNVGPGNATNVVIEDQMPANLTYSDWGIVERNGAIIYEDTLNIDDVILIASNITSGNYVSVWVTATVKTDKVGNITNVVTTACTENSTEVKNSTNVTVVPVVLNINKTANVTKVANNTLVKYTIVVNNTSEINITNVVVGDLLESQLTFVECGIVDANGQIVTIAKDQKVIVTLGQATTYSANVKVDVTKDIGSDRNNIYWVLSKMANNSSVEFWITVRVNTTVVGEIPNDARTWCTENTTPVVDVANITVVPVVLNINKTANVTKVTNATLVNYTIIVNNTSEVNATEVIVTDNLPANLTYVSGGVIDANGADVTNVTLSNGVQWNISRLAVNSIVKLWIVASVNTTQLGNITNDVTVKSKENDTEVKNSTDIEVVPVVLTINKTANVTQVANTNLVNFTIVVNNTALVNATDVVVVDQLPANLTYVDGGVIDDNGAGVTNVTLNNGVQWTVSYMESNAVVKFWITAIVDTQQVGKITNSVNVTCKENDTEVKNTTDIEVVPVVLNITKTVNKSPVANNTVVNFTIIVGNDDLGNATELVVIDELPVGLKFVDAGVIKDTNNVVTYLGQYNNGAKWNISRLNSKETVELWITARTDVTVAQTLTNKVNVTSKENDTEVKNTTDVEVVDIVLGINKTANVTIVGNNSLVNYTIVVSNYNKVTATNLTVCDELPEGLTFVNASETYSWNPSTRVISWNLTQLDANNIHEYYVTVRTNGTGLRTNKVNVTCAENKTEVKNTTNITVEGVNLTIVKSTNLTANANISDLIKFIINVTNNGPANATDVVISDEIMDVFDIQGGDYTKKDGNKLTWTIPKLDKGQTVSVYVIVNATVNGIYKNVAVANCNENKTNVTSEIPVIVEPAVSFELIKIANPEKVNVSDNVTFTITITNLGPSNATNVNITDVLDDAFKFDGKSTNLTCTFDGKTIVWNVGNLTNGSSVSVSFNVTVLTNGTFTNVATVNSTENETGATNETNVTALPVVNLGIIKEVTPGIVNVTDNVTFTITVTNYGPSNATNVNITDVLEDAFRFDGKSTNLTCSFDGKTIVWNVGSLANGSSFSVSFNVTVVKDGTFNNTVTTSCSENTTEVSNKTNVTALPVVNLGIIKEVTPGIVNVTDNVTFTITVTNYGPSNATNVIITDVLEDAFRFDGKSTNLTCSFDGKTIVWNVGSLANGSSFSVSFNVTVLRNGTFDNVATVNCTENTTGVDNKTNGTALPLVDLKVNKTVDNNNVSVGDEVTYTITVTNIGPSNATDVNVTDIMTGDVKITGVNTNNVGRYDEENGIWYIGALNKDAVVNMTITVKTLAVGKVENVVVVKSKENDTNTSNNEYPCENVTVNPYPSLVNGENVTRVYGEPISVDYNSTNATNVSYVIVDKDNNPVANGTVGPNGTINVTQLAVGNYTVYWNNTVDANHTPANNVSYITVLPAPSLVNGTNVTVNYGEPIKVDYDSTNATSVSYVIVDKNNVTVASGTVDVNGTIDVKPLAVGNYTVYWNNTVDGNHTPANNVSYITVLPMPSLVNGSDVNVTYGEPIIVDYESTNATNVTYEIFDSEGNPVVNGTVGPNGTIPVEQLPVGNYTVNWTTIVDGNHTPNTNTSVIIVNPAPSLVNGTDVNVTYGEPIVVPYDSTNATNVTYEIFDENGNSVANGTVGPNGTVPVDQLPVGNYTVNWTTIVDGNHTPATNTSTIAVNPAPSLVEGENVTVTYGDPIVVPYDSTNATNVTYEIFDENGNSVANGTVGPNGTIPVDQLPIGNYTVNWTTIVDGNHIPATNTSTIEVLPIPTQVTIGNVTTYPGENVTIPINVTTIDGQPFNGNVEVVMPDNSTQVVSVVNGTGNITWYVPEDYTPDKYPDTIIFPGTDTYLPSNGTGTIEVVKIPTHITVGNVTTFAGMNVTIPINVTADDDKPFNGNVTITFPDGTNKTVEIINGTGNTTWFVPYDYTPDKYPDTVKFDGDNKYLPSEGNGTITVIKIPVDIIVGNVTGRPGDDVVIPIEVIPREGPAFNGNVTVELPDGTIKIVEIINGKGKVPWTIPKDYKPGKYPVKVHSNETNIYYPANGTGIVTVIVDPEPPIPDDGNKTHNGTSKKAIPHNSLAKYETGNPIIALIMVLAFLGINIKRRK